MTLKLSAGFVLLFIALALQFWFASTGIYLNLAFAAIITFAFLFDFWELLVLDLLAVFVLNWQPAASVEILVFALYPIVVHFSHNISHLYSWVKAPIAIVIGFFVLYLSVSGVTFHWNSFFLDLGVALVFGLLMFLSLHRWGGK